jgi:hypothetical protein
MKRWFLSINALILIVGLHAAEAPPLFAQDFSKIEVGALPDDFLVLDGQFTVKEEDKNRFVELPGAPLESYGFLFGSNVPFDVEASARIFGTKIGRKYPTFGLGLYNSSGYRLQVAPAKEAVELLRGDSVVASAPFKWTSGQWTQLRLAVRKVSDHEFRLEGTAWLAGKEAPKEPLVTFTDAKIPPPGKASVWGLPFSGTPIRFDDLKVIPLGGS